MGRGGGNPRQMQAMMKKMGMTQDELEGVLKVTIETETATYILRGPQVIKMNVKGQTMWQVVGDAEVKSEGDAPPREDIELVMAQTGASEADTIKALKAAGGQPAEAILTLLGG